MALAFTMSEDRQRKRRTIRAETEGQSLLKRRTWTLAQHEIVQSKSVLVATQNQTPASVRMKSNRNGSQDSLDAVLHRAILGRIGPGRDGMKEAD